MKDLIFSFPIEKAYAVSVPQGGLDKAREAASVGVEILIIIAVLLALLFIIKSGIDLITAEGKKENLQKARTALFYGMLGLIIALISFAFMKTIIRSLVGN